MSTLETTPEAAAPVVKRKVSMPRRTVIAVDGVFGRLGDYLNPILIKEARQALKSKQFAITFALLLTLVWVWSILAGLYINPEDFANASRHSSGVFLGYFVLLAFPLIVVVPYGAFRSLAGEIEDGTYELLSITSLAPGQIISGKMGSALLQMMMYLSAVTPCLAFTYLLPGMDIVTIGLIILYITLQSIGLSIISLLLATVTSQRHWQLLLQVILILALGFVLLLTYSLFAELIGGRELESGLQSPGFWFGHFMMIAYFVSFFAILFMCAKAMITFRSENRSTGIRIALLFPPLIMFASMTFVYVNLERSPFVVPVAVCFIAGYWAIVGSMLTAESPFISDRVRRQLPTSLLGRACSAWFNPGPCSGLMFVILNMVAATLVVMSLGWILRSETFEYGSVEVIAKSADLSWMLLFYLVIYLGLNRLFMSWLHRVATLNVFLGFLTTLLMFLVGVAGPYLIQFILFGDDWFEWNMMHLSNPIYTMIEVADPFNNVASHATAFLTLGIIAAIVLLLNVRGIWLSVLYEKQATPDRIAIDDAENAPSKANDGPEMRNPWDEADGSNAEKR